MTRTPFQQPIAGDDAESDVAVINLTRLLTRLEQNLLSSSTDLKLLRQSRYHRARVGAVRCASLCLFLGTMNFLSTHRPPTLITF
jgi:hypothetical protein